MSPPLMSRLRAESVAVGARLVDVTLTFAPGTLTAIVGENGAGKSTLLDVLAGIHAPTAGRVLVDDRDLASYGPGDRARTIASLGQANVDVDDDAAERIAQGLSPRRGSHALVDDAAAARIRAVAGELGVDAFLERRLATLSTGERRRVEVARALVDELAPIVIVDEPHAAVDVRHQGIVTNALKKRAAAGAVVVISVHDLGVAAAADRIVGLRAGRVVVDGPPAESLTSKTVEALYGVAGAVVVREAGAVGVLIPSRVPP